MISELGEEIEMVKMSDDTTSFLLRGYVMYVPIIRCRLLACCSD